MNPMGSPSGTPKTIYRPARGGYTFSAPGSDRPPYPIRNRIEDDIAHPSDI